MTGSVQTLIDALRVLSRDIYCEDGVATAVIAEAADGWTRCGSPTRSMRP